MNAKIYPQTMSLFRDDFKNQSAYREALKDCKRHYSYKVRVGGGWKFFEFLNDLETWKKQK